MKNIYSIMLLLAGLFTFVACESDRDSNPTLHEPTTFVLNTPPYVSGVYDLKNTETIQLSCSQPDYGFTAATTYAVEVAIKADFENYATLPTTYTSAKMEVLGNEFAVAVCNLMVEANGYTENDFPTSLMPVYVRLAASLPEGRGQVNSNIIELPKVKPYFALEPMTLPDKMYIGGNVFGNGDWSKSVEMVPVYGASGKFWALQYFGTEDGGNAEVKFNTVKDASEGTPFGGNADIDDASKALANLSGDDALVVGKPGWYLVVVTTEISGRDYIYHLQFLEPNVYLTGDPSGGYDVFDETRLFTVPAGLGSFESQAFVADGELRICVKLDGEDWWHTEFVILKGKLEYRGAGGDQDRVKVTKGQKVFINFTDATGEIK